MTRVACHWGPDPGVRLAGPKHDGDRERPVGYQEAHT